MNGSEKMSKEVKDPLFTYKYYAVTENKNKNSDNCPLVLFRVCLFKCKCNSKLSHWESALKNANEGENCSKCDALVMPYSEIEGSTPYQSEKKVYGLYRCHKCSRFWESANSWANTSQKCEVCHISIYPFDQSLLIYGGKKNIDKGHLKEQCGMCKITGQDCSKLSKNPYVKSTGRRKSRKGGRGGGKPKNGQPTGTPASVQNVSPEMENQAPNQVGLENPKRRIRRRGQQKTNMTPLQVVASLVNASG